MTTPSAIAPTVVMCEWSPVRRGRASNIQPFSFVAASPNHALKKETAYLGNSLHHPDSALLSSRYLAKLVSDFAFGIAR